MPSDRILPPPPSLTPGSTVWAYLRDSGGSGQDRSIEQQRQTVIDYCTQHGLALIHAPFEDLHQSGKSTQGRTQFDQMIALSGSHAAKPAGLLIWNFARFARNLDDSQIFKSILRKRGIVIHSLTDNIPEGPFSAVIETLIHVSDEHKRAEAAAGAWRGLHAIVAQGAVPGTPPRGIKREPITVISEQGVERTAHRWLPDPEVAATIRQAFAMRAAGASVSAIKKATHLYKDLNSFSTFFRNRIYIGTLDYGGQTFPDYCEPIVDQQTWDAVQKIAAETARRNHLTSTSYNHPRRKNSSFLLAGLVYCARCGSALCGHNSPRQSYATDRSYRCNARTRARECDLPRIPAYALEKIILDGLSELGEKPAYLDEMHSLALDRSQNAAGDSAAQREQITAKLKPIRAKLTRLAAAMAETGHTPALVELNKTLEADRIELEQQLHDLRGQKPDSDPPAAPDEIRAWLLSIRPAVEVATLSEGQTILRSVLARAVVDRIDKELFIGLDVRIPKKKDHPPPEDTDIICVPIYQAPVGAQVYRHTIAASIKRKPRSH